MSMVTVAIKFIRLLPSKTLKLTKISWEKLNGMSLLWCLVVIQIGNAACHFAGSVPRNLAFRRNTYLVLMSGDVTWFPATQVDKRLR